MWVHPTNESAEVRASQRLAADHPTPVGAAGPSQMRAWRDETPGPYSLPRASPSILRVCPGACPSCPVLSTSCNTTWKRTAIAGGLGGSRGPCWECQPRPTLRRLELWLKWAGHRHSKEPMTGAIANLTTEGGQEERDLGHSDLWL